MGGCVTALVSLGEDWYVSKSQIALIRPSADSKHKTEVRLIDNTVLHVLPSPKELAAKVLAAGSPLEQAISSLTDVVREYDSLLRKSEERIAELTDRAKLLETELKALEARARESE
jgi:phage shock protein A